jgi:hypothetical protein
VDARERAEIEGYMKEMEALQAERAREAAAESPVDGSSAPAAAAQPVPDLSVHPPPPPIVQTNVREVAPRSPIYTRWWFWTGIGVAIAGGVVAAVVLNRSSVDVCPAGVNCQGMP